MYTARAVRDSKEQTVCHLFLGYGMRLGTLALLNPLQYNVDALNP